MFRRSLSRSILPADRHLVFLSLDPLIRPKDAFLPLGVSSLLANLDLVPIESPLLVDTFPFVRCYRRNRRSDNVTNEALRVGHATVLRAALEEADYNRDELKEALVELVDTDTDIACSVFAWNVAELEFLISWMREEGLLAGDSLVLAGGPEVCEAHFADVRFAGYAESELRDFYTHNNNDGSDSFRNRNFHDDRNNTSTTVYCSADAWTTSRSPLLSGLIESSSSNFLRWETKRGCYYDCSFCQHYLDPQDVSSSSSGRVQRRVVEIAPSRIAAEIDAILNSSIDDISVTDPLFFAGRTHDSNNSNNNYFSTNSSSPTSPSWESILLALRDGGYSGRFSVQTRFELLTPHILDLVASCSGSRFNIELEIGMQTIHQPEQLAVNRPTRMDSVDRGVGLLQEFGLLPITKVDFIYGLPLQTFDSFVSSVSWAEERGFEKIKCWPLLLLRGARLNEKTERDKYRLETEEGSCWRREVACSSTMSKEGMQKCRDFVTGRGYGDEQRVGGGSGML